MKFEKFGEQWYEPGEDGKLRCGRMLVNWGAVA